jgi:uncharacterized protein
VSGEPSNPATAERELVIWLLSDGKRGHETQAQGLSRAIESRIRARTHILPMPSPVRAWIDLFLLRTRLGRDLPDPDLIIAVGHRTHPALLAVRAARGGRAIVLMRPTLPITFFDLAIIPQHDAPKDWPNVITTRGVLNTIQPSGRQEPNRGLILLGGPSRHVEWSDEVIAQQVGEVVRASGEVSWHLTTSRRTPATTAEVMLAMGLPNLMVTPASDTPTGWVAQQLALCGKVWVSEDSVSMVYEALSAGAAVGLLHVPQRGRNRISAGVRDLIDDDMVTPFETWKRTGELPLPHTPLREAERCAELIVRQWLPRWGVAVEVDRKRRD